MTNDSMSKSGISIQADDKNGHLTGTGTLSVAGDEGSIMAAFTAQEGGKTQIALTLKKDVAISADESLAFEGHGDLDPKTGKLSAGTTITYTVDKDVAANLQAQFGQNGLNVQAGVNINF